MRTYKNGVKCTSNALLTDEAISDWLAESNCPSILKKLKKSGEGFWSLLYKGHILAVTIDNKDKLHYTINEALRKSSEDLNQWTGLGLSSFKVDMLEAYLPLKHSLKERTNSRHKRLVESMDDSLMSEIKEIYHDYVSDLSSTTDENLITISFTIAGAGTSFDEVEGDMDNIADAYGMFVVDLSCFCEEERDIDCDKYLKTGQPVEFCATFEYL